MPRTTSVIAMTARYWIDTNTQEGKNTYALILSFSAQGRGFWFDISDYTTPQQITWAGPW